MVTIFHSENSRASRFKSEHLRGSISTRSLAEDGIRVVESPLGSVLATILKTLETRLHHRVKFPAVPGKTFHPLWFLVETEINIFLWRSGFSLADKDNFEFWLDVPAMISKRITSLRTGLDNGPFQSPSWDPFITQAPPSSQVNEEISYLERLKEVFEGIAKEAYALSQVGSILYEEHSNTQRTKILLPCVPSRE